MYIPATNLCESAKSGRRNTDQAATTQRQHLSIPELALESNESEAVWRKRIFRKEIPYYKFGRNCRVARQDFEEFCAARRVEAR
jgi:hypothetical protein